MDTRIGTAGVLRLAVVLSLIALSLLMATALAAPTRADAHQTAGSTSIFVDGLRTLRTPDDHFTYSKVLSPGCHNVRVVHQRPSSSQGQRDCFKESRTLTVRVDHNSISMSL